MTVDAVVDAAADAVEVNTPVEVPEDEPRLPSLSPSRAADFKTCPLLYRFRTVDRLPERPTPDQARGTLVHAVLEKLFDLPAEERTPRAAADLVAPQWERLVEEHPELTDLFTAAPGAADPAAPAGTVASAGTVAPEGTVAPAGSPVEPELADPAGFLESARGLLGGYFAVEDPRRLEPSERECLVEAVVDEQLTIRGYVDRLDISPSGDLRVVDYKTGGAPREAFEARALFQLKFYALVLWRTRGVIPRVLRLLYLRDAEACDYTPDAEELTRFERNLMALWRAIEQATERRDFRPKPSRLCGWCAHQALCPAYGGTPPPYPERPAVADPHVGAPPDDDQLS